MYARRTMSRRPLSVRRLPCHVQRILLCRIMFIKMCKEIPFTLLIYRVMRIENPSSHGPHEPETPQMVNPRGGIKVWLQLLVLRLSRQESRYVR